MSAATTTPSAAAPTPRPTPKPASVIAGNSLWSDSFKRLRKNRMAVICSVFMIFMMLACFLGPWLAYHLAGLDPKIQDTANMAAPPSWQHWLGTDTLGRDMLVRVLDGGRIALSIGFVATFIAIIIGVTWGATAGYVGGKVDMVMMRIVDVLYGFPTLAFVIVLQATFGAKGTFVLFAVIGAISWLNMARIVRAQVLSLRHREFVEAARSLGATNPRILFLHIVPNVLGVVIIYATLSMPHIMLTEAFLSYIGLGVQAPASSWGTLVTEGSAYVLAYPWLLIGPGLAMSSTIFALNFLGDGLRDALDPKSLKA